MARDERRWHDRWRRPRLACGLRARRASETGRARCACNGASVLRRELAAYARHPRSPFCLGTGALPYRGGHSDRRERCDAIERKAAAASGFINRAATGRAIAASIAAIAATEAWSKCLRGNYGVQGPGTARNPMSSFDLFAGIVLLAASSWFLGELLERGISRGDCDLALRRAQPRVAIVSTRWPPPRRPNGQGHH